MGSVCTPVLSRPMKEENEQGDSQVPRPEGTATTAQSEPTHTKAVENLPDAGLKQLFRKTSDFTLQTPSDSESTGQLD